MTVYQLVKTSDHVLPGASYDIGVVDDSLRGRLGYRRFQPWDLPGPVQLHSQRSLTEVTDFPYVDSSWPVLSWRAVLALKAAGDFAHHLHSVELVSGGYTPRRLPQGADDFVLLQLTEHPPVLDGENSDCEWSDLFPGKQILGTIKRLAMIEPEEGFPIAFRMAESPAYGIFVNNAGRVALEAVGIRGALLNWVPSRPTGTSAKDPGPR